MHKISVLIPAYNTEAYIGECIESILKQSHPNLEIIIVDDGSNDDTVTVANRYAESENRIIVITTSHLGVAEARNECVRNATGDYILFVDSDDWIAPSLCAALILEAERTSADIVFSPMIMVSSDGTERIFGDRSTVFNDNDVLTGPDCFVRMLKAGCPYPMVAGNLYSRALFANNNLNFDGLYHEDELFTPKSLWIARNVTYYKKPSYYYRKRLGSIMNNPNNLRSRALCLYNHSVTLSKYIWNIQEVSKKIYEETTSWHCWNLKRRSKDYFESYFRQSEKKCLFIFTVDNTGNHYGVGTYIHTIQECLDPSLWDIIIVKLYSQNEYIEFSINSNSVEYSFPIPKPFKTTINEDVKKKYEYGVFFYLMSLATNRRPYSWFHFPEGKYIINCIKKHFQGKVIFTKHYSDWSFLLNGNENELRQILLNPQSTFDKSIKRSFRIEQDFMQLCDCIIAISKQTHKQLEEIYGVPKKKISLIYNAKAPSALIRTKESYNNLREKYGIPSYTKVVLFVGRVTEIKGINMLIDGFISLLNDELYSNCHLIIAGDGDISNMILKSGRYITNIHFLGKVSFVKLSELYVISDVGIVPSIYEEFGYTFLEMTQAALPVIASNVGGMREIASLNGLDIYTLSTPNDIRTNLISTLKKTPRFESLHRIHPSFSLDSFKNSINQLLH